jgi:hypothetical protein
MSGFQTFYGYMVLYYHIYITIFFIHSPTDNIHPLIFYILAIVNGAAINMGLQMALQHRQEKI